MKKKIINTIWVMGVLALAGFCLSACNHELDIQQAYPFTVETMPVQKHIVHRQGTDGGDTLYIEKGGKLCRYPLYHKVLSARWKGTAEDGRRHGLQAQ